MQAFQPIPTFEKDWSRPQVSRQRLYSSPLQPSFSIVSHIPLIGFAPTAG